MSPRTCKCGQPFNTGSMTFKVMKHPEITDSVFIVAKCKRCKKDYTHVANLDRSTSFGLSELPEGRHSL